jgi:hypothetical protein
MGKKGKRRILGPPGPKHFALRKAGKVIVATRQGAISELLDCAVWMWFLEQTPLSIHVLAMAAYQCLEDLGKETGNGPTLKSKMGADKFTTYYDYLRHSSGSTATGLDFPPLLNGPIIFDAVIAFQRIFNGYTTAAMLAFTAYFAIIRPGIDPGDFPESPESYAGKLLPRGITLEEVRAIDRMEAYDRLTKLFGAQSGVSHIESP